MESRNLIKKVGKECPYKPLTLGITPSTVKTTLQEQRGACCAHEPKSAQPSGAEVAGW